MEFALAILFDPLKVGALTLPNRIVMAPLTRSRAHPDTRVPSDLAVTYYTQRASAGLILTEATSVSPMGVGYAGTPGIWSEEQTEGWRKIVQAVQDAGGRILLQLWHVGRISDPMFLNGATPVSASAVRPAGHVSLVRPEKDFVTPCALDLDEIPGVIAAFRKGAQNAKSAGFDGVEIHGANGYLIDQFLRDGTNKRTDAYGGLSFGPAAKSILKGEEQLTIAVPPARKRMRRQRSEGPPDPCFEALRDSMAR